MFRAIVTGVVALCAVISVLGAVFAVGALRIKMADDGPSNLAVIPQSALLATTQPDAASQPTTQNSVDVQAEAVPVINPLSIELSAESAKLTAGLKLEDDAVVGKARPAVVVKKGRSTRVGAPDAPVVLKRAIIGWHGSQDTAEWSVTIPAQGVYEVEIVCACLSESASGFGYTLTLADQEIKAQTNPPSGRKSASFKMLTAGNATLPAGPVTVQFHLADTSHHVAYLKLRSVRLIPAS